MYTSPESVAVEGVSKEVKIGSDVTLSCVISGLTEESADVVWKYSNATVISANPDYVIDINATFADGSQTTTLAVDGSVVTVDTVFTCMINSSLTATVVLNIFGMSIIFT